MIAEKIDENGSLSDLYNLAEKVVHQGKETDLGKFMDYSIPEPDKEFLYRFPWSINDNPVGWVEITDKCNIYCKGCYRNRLDGHKSLLDIKAEINFTKKWRKVDTIYLAGGEPLIHPDIVEIVKYITSIRLKPTIISNGQALTENMLRDLKWAGLMEISFHVDSGQIRKGWTGKDEVELIQLRQKFADLLHKVGGVKCNFNMTVSKRNVEDVPKTVQCALDNRGKVTGLTIITLRGAMLGEGDEFFANGQKVKLSQKDLGYMSNVDISSSYLKSHDVFRLLKTNFKNYAAGAYLGGTLSHTSIKWLVGLALCSGNKIVGSVGPAGMEFFQSGHHWFKGNYSVGSKAPIGRSIFLLAFVDKNVRKVFWKFLLRPWLFFRKFYGISLAIIQPPDILKNGTVEMCDSCPDLTLYNGELVNSCRLDEVRLYGSLISRIVAKN